MKPLWILTYNNYVHVSPTLLLYLDSEGFRPTVSKTGDSLPYSGTAIHTCLVNKKARTTPFYSCIPSLFSPSFSAHLTGLRQQFQRSDYEEGVTA